MGKTPFKTSMHAKYIVSTLFSLFLKLIVYIKLFGDYEIFAIISCKHNVYSHKFILFHYIQTFLSCNTIFSVISGLIWIVELNRYMYDVKIVWYTGTSF